MFSKNLFFVPDRKPDRLLGYKESLVEEGRREKPHVQMAMGQPQFFLPQR